VCASCKAPVIWAMTENGKRMPVDAEPVESGTILLSHRLPAQPPVALVQRAAGLAKLRAEHERSPQEGPLRLFTSHFATCPHADQHRRRATSSAGDPSS
jgi:hypothetical protein